MAMIGSRRALLAGSPRPVYFENFLAETTLSANLSFSRTSSATYINASGSLALAGNHLARFDHDTLGTPLGLLIEASTTNIQESSNGFSNAPWTSVANTLSESGIGIDGLNSLWTLTTNNATTANLFNTAAGAASGETTTYVVKYNNNQWVYIDIFQSPTDNIVWFDLLNGVVGGNTPGSRGSIRNIGNGFFIIAATAPTTTGTILPSAPLPVSANNSTTRVNGGKVYFQFAQSASLWSSYIPTIGSTVTRSADVATLSGAYSTAASGGPSILKAAAENTGTITYLRYAAGAFPSSFPTGYYYKALAIYPPGTSVTNVAF